MTKGKYLWLRNNFSTFTSQFIDTFTIVSLLIIFEILPAYIISKNNILINMFTTKYPGLSYLIIGIIFIIIMPLFLGGFKESFQHMLEHIWYDLTVELHIHMLIAGVIITIYSVVKIIKNICC
mgnify:CR=1 FL=1